VTGGYLKLTPERLREPQQVEDKLLKLTRAKRSQWLVTPERAADTRMST
jgi:hypothetical protein